MLDYTDIFIKLLLSSILGAIIGLERELKRKPLGLKTCLVISIVSCLLTIVSIQSSYNFPHSTENRITMDPLRLAAQIISGVGFIGAGVILRRGNDSIAGLTTAAMIWGASGLGIAVGAGFYFESILGMIMIIFSVEIIPYLITLIGPKRLKQSEISLKFIVKDSYSMITVIDKLKSLGYNVRNVKIKQLNESDHSLQMKLSVDQTIRSTEVYHTIQEIEHITNIEVERL